MYIQIQGQNLRVFSIQYSPHPVQITSATQQNYSIPIYPLFSPLSTSFCITTRVINLSFGASPMVQKWKRCALMRSTNYIITLNLYLHFNSVKNNFQMYHSHFYANSKPKWTCKSALQLKYLIWRHTNDVIPPLLYTILLCLITPQIC